MIKINDDQRAALLSPEAATSGSNAVADAFGGAAALAKIREEFDIEGYDIEGYVNVRS